MEITGIMIYYYFVCKRKLWYFKNEINMEQNSDLVELGKILHEDSYNREKKSILINNTINVDFINHKTILHEVKKSKSIEEASIWQLKYYMYYLWKNGVKNISGEIDYPILRQKRTIEILTEISYVNTIIYTRVLSEIYKTQLNPTISYLHEPSERRFSLCLDISEIFKPIIADRLIFSMFNKNQITEKDFEKNLNYMYIKDNARKQITMEIDKKLQTTVMHKKLGREVTYEYLIRLELYKLIKYLIEDEEYEGFQMCW